MFDKSLIHEITQIASDHDLEPAALLAIVAVESNGKLGAWIEGKFEPLIRFEGHYFYRLLTHSKRNIAIVEGLATASAGGIKNPMRQKARWQMLRRAEKIDRCSALESCSWGLGQVMGSHWRWLGYASIDALVLEARSGVVGQVQLMMRFITKARLISKLKHLDWVGFARAYNGPNYHQHKYHLKMKAAYEQFCKELQFEPMFEPISPRHKIKTLQLGSWGNDVRQLQSDLNKVGFALIEDGDFGPATEIALKQFQRQSRLMVDGIYGPKSLEVLYRKLPVNLLGS